MSQVSLSKRRPRRQVVVCGAGAAGMAAAIAAAREGSTVHLIEAASAPGGTAANCLIHTLGGLYDRHGGPLHNGLVGGLVAELIERLRETGTAARPRRMGRLWVLNVCPAAYRRAVRRWLASERLIELHTNSRVTRVMTDDRRVVGVVAHGRAAEVHLKADVLIDATGTAEVVRRIDRSLVISDRAAAGGLIFRLRGMAPGTLDFPRGLGLCRALATAAQTGLLPPACAKAWLDSGITADEAYLKMFVPLGAYWRRRRSEISEQARQEGLAVVSYLRERPEFAGAQICRIGRLGVRDGGRIRGEYCLTVDDVRQGRQFADAACRGCWPIEYWDPVDGVSVEHLPGEGTYEIPLRSLKVFGWHNVWAAGKCLSADRYAQASARVVGTCWAMGAAVALAARPLVASV